MGEFHDAQMRDNGFSDPRLTVGALVARGVNFSAFDFVWVYMNKKLVFRDGRELGWLSYSTLDM
jgi:hypothetical protein